MTEAATVTPSFRLDGRRAAVTGAGRGIGLACARALAQAGAEVTLLARTGSEIEAAAAAIRAEGGSAEAAALDVTDLEAAAGGAGSIVNMSSQMGHVGGPERAVYCASKHAVEGMTKAMALELAPKGIRANTLCPTFVETPMTAPMLAKPEFRAFVEASIPLGRTGRLEDLMGAVVFLASDASALFTGSALMADGGWTAR